MEMIPTDRLVRLLSVLEINVRGADKLSLIADPVCNFTFTPISITFLIKHILIVLSIFLG